MTQLSQKALLVSLHIKVYNGKISDNQVTREVDEAHNSSGAGKYIKHLVNQNAVKAVQKAASALRQYHYSKSLPWGNSGERLLPSELYFSYLEGFGALQQKFQTEVDSFIASYSDLLSEAETRLNGLFKADECPSVDDLKYKFSVDLNMSALAEATDFRVQLGEDEVDKIKRQITETINKNQTQATEDLWNRIRDAIKSMVERLDGEDKVFRDTLVENIRDLTELLPKMNITGDRKIDDICMEMRDLTKYSPDTLRKNSSARISTHDRAKNILSDYGI